MEFESLVKKMCIGGTINFSQLPNLPKIKMNRIHQLSEKYHQHFRIDNQIDAVDIDGNLS